jgi:CheY-like chemotaxis protein
MSLAVATPRRRVAVADDNPEYRAQKSHLVELAGFHAVQMTGHFPSVADLIVALGKSGASALVCDHKLSEGNYAGFQGVEAVAHLYGSATPALLVTDYVDSDLKHSIRKHRRRVPVLIRGSEMRPRIIQSGIEAWEKEVIYKEIPVTRRPRRTFVVLDEIANAANGEMYTVFIPRWREHEAVSLPLDSIPIAVRPGLKKGSILLASVNTEAERIDDLYFENFETTPDEDLENEPA